MSENNFQMNEEYIGKLPEMKQIERLFDDILIRAKATPNIMNPNTWPENTKIQSIFKKFFGFDKFTLYWVASDARNAYTITDTLLLGDSYDEAIVAAQRKKGRGFYDETHNLNIIVFAYCGLLRPEFRITGGELLAIFLHEIGHNFDYPPQRCGYLARRIYMRNAKKKLTELGLTDDDLASMPKETADDLKTTMSYSSYKDFLADSIATDSDFTYRWQPMRNSQRKHDSEVMKYIYNSKMFLFVQGFFTQILNVIFGITGVQLLMAMALIDGRKGEQFADSMSAAYGYGPELISGLEKLSDYKKYIVNNHFPAKILRDYYLANSEMMLLYSDEHGSNQSRAMDCILKLERDLKSGDYPPEMKSTLIDEIRRLKQEYNDIVNCSPDTKLSLLRGWRKFADKICKGRPDLIRFVKPRQM